MAARKRRRRTAPAKSRRRRRWPRVAGGRARARRRDPHGLVEAGTCAFPRLSALDREAAGRRKRSRRSLAGGASRGLARSRPGRAGSWGLGRFSAAEGAAAVARKSSPNGFAGGAAAVARLWPGMARLRVAPEASSPNRFAEVWPSGGGPRAWSGRGREWRGYGPCPCPRRMARPRVARKFVAEALCRSLAGRRGQGLRPVVAGMARSWACRLSAVDGAAAGRAKIRRQTASPKSGRPARSRALAPLSPRTGVAVYRPAGSPASSASRPRRWRPIRHLSSQLAHHLCRSTTSGRWPETVTGGVDTDAGRSRPVMPLRPGAATVPAFLTRLRGSPVLVSTVVAARGDGGVRTDEAGAGGAVARSPRRSPATSGPVPRTPERQQ